MTAVDTNVLVRWLVNDHPVQARKASTMIDGAETDSLQLDRLILAELTYVLRSNYEMPKNIIVDNLRVILATEAFFIDVPELVRATVDIFANERPLSFEDSWLLAQKRAGDVSGIMTFDKALDKRQ